MHADANVITISNFYSKKLMADKIVSPDLYHLLTIVRSPDVRDEMRSLPARAQTIVLWAPDTAGP